MSPTSPIYKIEHRKIGNHIRLTSEENTYYISKGQVALKEVQPLDEIPPCFPHEIDLHSEGETEVPKE